MAKILVVDDTEVTRQQLGDVLQAAGHTVVYAADGAQGLVRASEHPDLGLIVSDYNMPEMDGLTMLRRIRGLPGFTGLPSFMLTTESSPELKAMAKAYGVRAWIIKPCAPEKVLAAALKILSE